MGLKKKIRELKTQVMEIFEAKKVTFDFLAWIITKFVPEEKRYNVKKRITYYPYYYLTKMRARELGNGLQIGGVTVVTWNTYLSDCVSFNGMIIQGGGKVTIGKYFHSGEDCRIICQNHNFDCGKAIPYDDTYICKDVEIGDFVWIGTKVTILPGTKIGEGAIIQAGSVVHGEIPPYAIAGGNPCKVFKYRDIEHFKKLKEEGKFA